MTDARLDAALFARPWRTARSLTASVVLLAVTLLATVGCDGGSPGADASLVSASGPTLVGVQVGRLVDVALLDAGHAHEQLSAKLHEFGHQFLNGRKTAWSPHVVRVTSAGQVNAVALQNDRRLDVHGQGRIGHDKRHRRLFRIIVGMGANV